MDALDPRHGTNAGYLAHRRSDKAACAACRTAHVHYEKRRIYDNHLDRPRLIDVTGTRRRLEALVALGWTYSAIGQRAGMTLSGVHKALNRYTVIRREVAEKYAAVYEEMSMTLPPTETRQQKRDASYARTVARKRGFLPPLVWDNIDDPNERPRGIRANERRDLLADWAELWEAGESREQAARRLGVTVGAIERAEYRARAVAS